MNFIEKIDKSKIPIVVISYNRIECLYLTISSILNSIDLSRYQIIVWDDCSTDIRISEWLRGKKNITFQYDYTQLIDFLKMQGCEQDLKAARKNRAYLMPSSKDFAFHINVENIGKGLLKNYAKNGFLMLETVYEAYEHPDFFHTVENDVLFCKDCFSISEKICLEQINVGCVQSGRTSSTRLFKSNIADIENYRIRIQDSDGCGSQHMCVAKRTIEALIQNGMFKQNSYRNGFDWTLHHFIYTHGFRVVNFSNKSLYCHFSNNTSFGSNFKETMTNAPDFSKIRVFGLD